MDVPKGASLLGKDLNDQYNNAMHVVMPIIASVSLVVLVAAIAPLYVYQGANEFNDEDAAGMDYRVGIAMILIAALVLAGTLIASGYMAGVADGTGKTTGFLGQALRAAGLNIPQTAAAGIGAVERQQKITTVAAMSDATIAFAAIVFAVSIITLSITVDIFFTQEASVGDGAEGISQDSIEAFAITGVVLSVFATLGSGVVLGIFAAGSDHIRKLSTSMSLSRSGTPL